MHACMQDEWMNEWIKELLWIINYEFKNGIWSQTWFFCFTFVLLTLKSDVDNILRITHLQNAKQKHFFIGPLH